LNVWGSFREGADARRRSADEIDESVDPRIQALWRTGNADGLIRFFESESDAARQLEAAEALAIWATKRRLTSDRGA